MAGTMVRCVGERDGERCHRYNRLIVLNGAKADADFAYKCEGCSTGQKPYIPRNSERKGQQKQASKKKK